MPLLALLFALFTAQTPSRESPTTYPSGLPLNLNALQTSVDSFAMRVQGREIGGQRYSLTRTANGFSLTEETKTPAGGQKTKMELNAKGEIRSIEQTGAMGGNSTHISLVYDGGRVRGESQLPGGALKKIDTAVPAGVIDDNILHALLPALPWSSDASWTFQMYSGGKDAIAERTLRVASVETVDVPAGKAETYRAEMATAEATVSFYVTTAAPHRLMRITIAGTPLEFVRVK